MGYNDQLIIIIIIIAVIYVYSIGTGFVEGRQYGRGKSGGQVRDEYRNDFDHGRGGYGKLMQQRVEGPL